MATRKQIEEYYEKLYRNINRCISIILEAQEKGAMDKTPFDKTIQESPIASLNQALSRAEEKFKNPIARETFSSIRCKNYR